MSVPGPLRSVVLNMARHPCLKGDAPSLKSLTNLATPSRSISNIVEPTQEEVSEKKRGDLKVAVVDITSGSSSSALRVLPSIFLDCLSNTPNVGDLTFFSSRLDSADSFGWKDLICTAMGSHCNPKELKFSPREAMTLSRSSIRAGGPFDTVFAVVCPEALEIKGKEFQKTYLLNTKEVVVITDRSFWGTSSQVFSGKGRSEIKTQLWDEWLNNTSCPLSYPSSRFQEQTPRDRAFVEESIHRLMSHVLRTR